MDSGVIRGKSLAAIHCQSCHLLPDPGLLDKETWVKKVLPGMAPRLGIFSFKGHEYPSSASDLNIGIKFYPLQPVVNEQQWQDLLNYYWAYAPDSLAPDKRSDAIKSAESLFRVQFPPVPDKTASTCMVRFNKDSTIWISKMIDPGIYRYNSGLQFMDSISTRGPVVNIQIERKEVIACNIGYLNPNDSKLGSISKISFNPKSRKVISSVLLLQNLARPVQVTEADLNQDDNPDWLVCEFGNLRGSLTWFEIKGNTPIPHVLRGLPGAIKAYIQDYNHDGLPDIWALFAQGDECIILYTNKGNGRFEEKKILSFPAVYGSTYFEMDDFNGDGIPDILYSCGDNADYSPVLKPYHGVYIFLNQGNNQFIQKYFFPMHGCFKAMARDFDGDGDLDIAAISFFADYKHHPEEGFIYLKNQGNLNFEPFILPETTGGRWLTMDVGDFYRSGRPDIILGNYHVGIPATGDSNYKINSSPFILLRNMMK